MSCKVGQHQTLKGCFGVDLFVCAQMVMTCFFQEKRYELPLVVEAKESMGYRAPGHRDFGDTCYGWVNGLGSHPGSKCHRGASHTGHLPVGSTAHSPDLADVCSEPS